MSIDLNEANPETTTDSGVRRRRFLQAMAAVGGAAAMPAWMHEVAAAATPIGSKDGIIVHIMMEGGNDGINTLIPVKDSAYYSQRGNLAIAEGSALPLTSNRRLHRALPTLKSLYDQGNVAFIEGLGIVGGSLSHFDSAAMIESGNPNSALGTTGWLGRYTDRLPGGSDAFHAVSIGSRVPLVVRGARRDATGVPLSMPSNVRRQGAESYVIRSLSAMRSLGDGDFGRGALANDVGSTVGQSIDVAATIESMFGADGESDSLAAQLTMVARLINADLGIRVFTVTFGDFDTHAEQPKRHQEALAEFDAGIKAFHEVLNTRFAGRTLLYAMSEFGRRVRPNGSNGTDHGSAGLAIAIGQQVKGGMYGSLPSLANLDRSGNMVPTVDFRSVYSTILTSWLAGDSSAILGQPPTNMGFLGSPTADAGPPPILAATIETKYRRVYDQVALLYLAYFKRTPDEAGFAHWVGLAAAGLPLGEISEAFAQSQEFVGRYGTLSNHEFVKLIYQNVLDRAPDAAGHSYWREILDAGSTRGTVMIGFADSSEFRGKTASARQRFDSIGPVGRLYLAYFLREPDAAGLNHWISTGLPKAVVSQEFAQSAEFKTRYGALSNADFVNLVYNNVLRRKPDTDGGRYWTARLDSGLSRGEVMLGFSDSPEFVSKVSKS